MVGKPQPKKEIHPTGTCFDDAVLYMAMMCKEFGPALLSKNPRFKIAHGICRLANGDPYAHAWVEEDEKFAIFCGILEGEKQFFRGELGEFHQEYRVQEKTLYTLMEAVELEQRVYRCFGPWKPKYRALTKEAKQKHRRKGKR